MLDRYLSIKFWFISGTVTERTIWIIGIVMALFLITGIAVGQYKKANKKKLDSFAKKLYKKITDLTLSMGIAGLFLLFFIYEGVYIMSMKFWFVIWFIIVAVWGISIAKYARTITSKRSEIARQRQYNKYLP